MDTSTIDARKIRLIHRVTSLVLAYAILFNLFFFVNKGGPFRDVNPFAGDPYDAVGSFAIQVALLVGLLSYARSLRLRDDVAQSARARLILRGNGVVLLAASAALVVDGVAEVVNGREPSYWGRLLLIELALMFLITLVCAIVVAIGWARVPTGRPPRDLCPGDAIDDLWTLVRVPVVGASSLLPDALVGWVRRFTSASLFAKAPWINPRTHPWRFACALGLLVGMALAAAQLQEGLPPSLEIGLRVSGIFVGGELFATLLGFGVLGGCLGLRPTFHDGG